MRVSCPHCKSKALITSSNALSKQVKDLYCKCKNLQCGARFVFTLAFKEIINPPAHSTAQIALELVRRMTTEEKSQTKPII